jgi:methylenetetrahydrofolate reductase (NADPH)
LSIPISFEVYPPREPEAGPALYEAIDRLSELSPDFISVTFGAGGSDTQGSIEVLSYIKHQTQAVPLAHLTCVGTSERESRSTIQQFLDAGILDFLALRGDLPDGQEQLPADALANASELVGVIRDVAKAPGAKVAVAAFPNGHPESGAERSDLLALKAKQEAGADFAITQLFFFAEDYFNFLELARACGITIPIIPGIMPITSAKRLSRVLELTGEREPKELSLALSSAADAAARLEVGINWAARVVSELVAGGAPGIHLYAFNEHKNVTEVLRRAGMV